MTNSITIKNTPAPFSVKIQTIGELEQELAETNLTCRALTLLSTRLEEAEAKLTSHEKSADAAHDEIAYLNGLLDDAYDALEDFGVDVGDPRVGGDD